MGIPNVTVVVLNWNGWEDTLKCLASLRRLAAPIPHILLVDNHSTDGSVGRIRQVYPDLEILETPANLGFGGGCNVGIRYALNRGADYVWLLNNDAIVNEITLTELISLAELKPLAGAVGSVIYEINEPTRVQVWGGGRVNLFLGRSCLLKTPGIVHFLSGASLLLRGSVIKDLGTFDENNFFMYWEDTDLGFRIRQAGWDLAVAENSKVWHKLSASLEKGNPHIDQMFVCSAIRFLRIYASQPKIAITFLLITLIIKRIIFCRWSNLRSVIKGALSA